MSVNMTHSGKGRVSVLNSPKLISSKFFLSERKAEVGKVAGSRSPRKLSAALGIDSDSATCLSLLRQQPLTS